MVEVMEQRLEAKKRRLTQLQEYFQVDLKNINSSTYEDNVEVKASVKKIIINENEIRFLSGKYKAFGEYKSRCFCFTHKIIV